MLICALYGVRIGLNWYLPGDNFVLHWLVSLAISHLTSFGVRCVTRACLRHFANLFMQLGDRKRLALDLVETYRVNQVAASDQGSKLSHVQFWNQYLLVARDDFAKVAWKWIQVANMSQSDTAPIGLCVFDCC